MNNSSLCTRLALYAGLLAVCCNAKPLEPVTLSTLSPFFCAAYAPVGWEFSRNIGINEEGGFICVLSGATAATSPDGTVWTLQNLSLASAYPSGGGPANHHGTFGDLKGNVFWSYVSGCQGYLGVETPRFFKKASYRSGLLSSSDNYRITDTVDGSPNYFCSYSGYGGCAISEDTIVVSYQFTHRNGYEAPHVLISYDGGVHFQGLGGGSAQVAPGEQRSGYSLCNAPQVIPFQGGIMAIWVTSENWRFQYRFFNGSAWEDVGTIENFFPELSGLTTFRTTADADHVYLICLASGTENLVSYIWDGTAWTKKVLVRNKEYIVRDPVNTVCGDWVYTFWCENPANGETKAIMCQGYNRNTDTWMDAPVMVLDDGKTHRHLAAPHVSPSGYVPLAWIDTTDWAGEGNIRFCKIPADSLSGTSGVTHSAGRLALFPFSLSVTPNPSTGPASVYYSLPSAGTVSLKVLNPQGRLLRKFVSERQTGGEHRLAVSMDELPAGIYLLALKYGNQVKNAKIIRFK
ncbi:MAG: T9SS type A sorting domain-containing protein [Fibrobacterota bacterium]